MISDDNQSAARTNKLCGCSKQVFQSIHFMIHLNAECLKQFRQFFLFAFSRKKLMYNID